MFVHSINTFLKDMDKSSNIYLLKVDLKNAFNLVDREAFFQQVREVCPSISSYIEFCYTDPAMLFVDGNILFSYTGVQQDDPLGPLLFSLVLQKIINKIVEECPDLLINSWYLDDGTLVGDSNTINKVLQILSTHGPPNGLYLNTSKCEIWSPTDSSLECFPAEVIRIYRKGVDLLGSALGDPEITVKIILKRVGKIKQLVSLLSEVNDAEIEYRLLKSCIGMPKFNFALRSRHPDDIEEAIKEFDKTMFTGIENIIGNHSITDWDRLCISLPFALSGLGIPLANKVAPAAYLGSKIQTLSLQSKILQKVNNMEEAKLISDGENLFSSLISPLVLENSSDMLTYDKILRSKEPQHTIYLAICDKLFKDYMESDEVSLRCKKTAKVGCGDNGHFLDVVLLDGRKMNSTEFRVAIKLYLGFPVFSTSNNTYIQCPCCKKGGLDKHGDHAIVCAGSNDCSVRHNAVRDRLAMAAKDGQFAVTIEKSDVLNDGTQSKPADIYIPFWNYGKAIAIDVTGAPSCDFSENVEEPLIEAANRKNTKFLRRCNESDIMFKPFVFGSLGNFEEDSIAIIKKIGVAQSRRMGCKSEDCVRWLKGALSFDIMKSQANSIIRRGEMKDVLIY